MILYTVSIDSSTPEQCAMVRVEMEEALGLASDPLDLLIAEEEGEFDIEFTTQYLRAIHIRVGRLTQRHR